MVLRNYCISEYGYLASRRWANVEHTGSVLLSEKEFDEIEDYVIKNEISDNGEVTSFLVRSYSRTAGRILKAQNYVGVIQTGEGTTIEILPKIYCDEIGCANVRKIFADMLKSLKESPFKRFNEALLRHNTLQQSCLGLPIFFKCNFPYSKNKFLFKVESVIFV